MVRFAELDAGLFLDDSAALATEGSGDEALAVGAREVAITRASISSAEGNVFGTPSGGMIVDDAGFVTEGSGGGLSNTSSFLLALSEPGNKVSSGFLPVAKDL